MKDKGITLIALIISIIIMIILAAICIKIVYDTKMISLAVNGAKDYADEAKREQEELDDVAHYIEVVKNKNPVIREIEIIEITAVSAKIRVKATDEDKENLTYKLYFGIDKDNLEEQAVKEEIEQGVEVEFEIAGIDTTKLYYYRIDVSDNYVTVKSQVSTLQNKKPKIEKAEITETTKITAKAIIKGTDEDIGDKLIYKVYYGTDKDTLEITGKMIEKENISSGIEEIFVITELTPGIKYYYKIAITDGMQTASEEGEFTTISNSTPIINPTVTKGITTHGDPRYSTSWIQVSVKVEDIDPDEKLEVKIYLGTSTAENLGEEDLILSEINASSRNSSDKESR